MADLEIIRFTSGATEFGLHSHSRYEVALQLRGTVSQRSGKRSHAGILSPGWSYVAEPGQDHGGHCTRGVTRLHLFIEPAWLSALIASSGNVHGALRGGLRLPDPALAELFLLLERRAVQSRFDDIFADAARVSLVGRLLELPPADLDGRMLTPTELHLVTDYVESVLAEGPRLDDIARLVAMSPFHFSRIFKRTTGRSPHRFVLERRVARATTLLRDTTRPISDIALSVGFSSQAHLGAAIRRLAGTTPGALRRSKRSERGVPSPEPQQSVG